jgi:hypothetical protein
MIKACIREEPWATMNSAVIAENQIAGTRDDDDDVISFSICGGEESQA